MITIEQKIDDLKAAFQDARVNGRHLAKIDWDTVPETGIEAMWHCWKLSQENGAPGYFTAFAYTTMYLVRMNNVSWQKKFSQLQAEYQRMAYDEDENYYAGTGTD